MPAVIGVSGRSTGHFAKIVTGDNSVGVRAADAAWSLGSDAAWSHVTNTTADAVFAEGALGRLKVHSREAGIGTLGLGLAKNFN